MPPPADAGWREVIRALPFGAVSRTLGTRAVSAQEAIATLAGSVRDPLELLDEVRQRIARVVPNAGGAWILTDPQTLMPVSVIKDLQTPASAGRRTGASS